MGLWILTALLAAAAVFVWAKWRITVDGGPREGFFTVRLQLFRLTLWRGVFCLRLRAPLRLRLARVRSRRRFRVLFRWPGHTPKKKRTSPAKRRLAAAVRRAGRIERLQLFLSLCLGDAAATALLCGMLSDLFGALFAVLSDGSGAARAAVAPDFTKAEAHLHICAVQGIFSIRIADIIRSMIPQERR